MYFLPVQLINLNFPLAFVLVEKGDSIQGTGWGGF